MAELTYTDYFKDLRYPLLGLFLIYITEFMNFPLYVGFLVFVYLLVFKKNSFWKEQDGTSLILVIFCFVYGLFSYLNGYGSPFVTATNLVLPITFFTLGKIMMNYKLGQDRLLKLLVLIGFLYSITGLLSVGKLIVTNGFVADGREVPNFWNNNEMSATKTAIYFLFNLMIPGILITSGKVFALFEKAFLIGVYILTLLCTFRIGSRTLIVITLFSFVFGLGYYLITNNFRNNIKMLFLLLGVSFLSIKYIPFDLNADYLSVLGDRLQDKNASSVSTAGNRTALWSHAVNNLLEKPLGWISEEYAHNVWLDAAKTSGLFAFIFLIIFTLSNLINLYKFFKNQKNKLAFKVTFGLYTLGMMVYFFTEPVLEGSFLAFTLFCFIQGYLKKINLLHFEAPNTVAVSKA